MKIVEIAKTIHGELPLTGTPCVLVRLAGCNLNCPYCDTNFSMKMEMTPEEVVKAVADTGLLNVLITGGEPLLQIEEIDKVLKLFTDQYILGPSGSVVIETNGTIPLGKLWDLPSYPCTFVYDLKHISILGPAGFADSLEVISYAMKRDVIKFVFWDENSFNFYYEVAQDLDTLATIAFSPTWDLLTRCLNRSEAFEQLTEWISKVVTLQEKDDSSKFAFQVQLHKLLRIR